MTSFRQHTMASEVPTDQFQLLTEIMAAKKPGYTTESHATGILPFAPKRPYSFLYINNPDQTVRWVIPQQAQKPHFLSLYSANSLKAWIFRKGVKLGYKLGHKERVFQGGFLLDEKEDWKLPELLYQLAGHEYAIFTGTAGKTRKTVAAIAPKGKVSHFIKIAHTQRAQALLDNEHEVLNSLRQQSFSHIEIPQSEKLPYDNMIMLSNVKPEQVEQSSTFSEVHMNGLKEIWQHITVDSPQSTGWYEEVFAKLSEIPAATDFPNDLNRNVLQALIDRLRKLGDELMQEDSIMTAMGHGDFTPWNMYVSNDKLHLFDWEYAKKDYPLYFDFFHYYYQAEILLRKGEKELFVEMATLASQHLNVQWPVLHKWYLLITLTNYLHDYSTWENVFPQAHWLVEAWLKIMEKI